MDNNLKEMASSVNNNLADLKVLIAGLELKFKKELPKDEIFLGLNTIKSKIDDMSTHLFQFLQTEKEYPIKRFIENNLDNISNNGKIQYKIMGTQEFRLNTTDKKLLTFFKLLSFHAAAVKASVIQIHQTKSYILIKDNGEKVSDNLLKKYSTSNKMTEDNTHLTIIIALKKFCKDHHMDFDFSVPISSNGHVITIKKRP